MTENTLAAEAAQGAETVVATPPETAAPVADTTPATTPEAAAAEAGETNAADDRRENRRTARERIAQLTRQKRELEEQVARLTAKTAPPKIEDFADPAEYDRAQQKHAAREVLADVAAEQVRGEEARIKAEVQTAWSESVAAFKATAPDFEAVVYRPDVPINQTMADTLMVMDDGPALAYHLGRNPHEAARLAALPPVLAAAEMGRMAERLRAPPRRVASSAPPPVAPVVGAGGPVSKSPAEMTQAEYNAWRRGK